MSPATSIDCLPDKIMEHIFQYFSCDELMSLSSVSTKWSEIIGRMAKVAHFNETHSPTDIVEMLYMFPESFSTISLTQCRGDLSVILRKIRRNQSVLKTLVINDCKIGDENAAKSGRRLEKVLKDCDQLKAITLINLSYELSELIMAFPRLVHLSSLTIGNNPCMRSHDLLTIVLNCHSLNSLHLYRVEDLNEHDIRLMVLRLKDRLRTLVLDRVFELNEAAYEYILECDQLEKLRINYSTAFSPKTMLKFPNVLKRLKSLQLERTCQISDESLQELFRNPNLQLQVFGLTDCCTHFSNESLVKLQLGQHRTLVKLILKNCTKLNDIQPLFNCPEDDGSFLLTELNLTGCSKIVTDKMAKFKSSCSMTTLILPDHLEPYRSLLRRFESNIAVFGGSKQYEDLYELSENYSEGQAQQK